MLMLLMRPDKVNDCLILLRYHLMNPEVPLLVSPDEITQELVEACVLTPQGFFNPNLEALTPLLDSPGLAGCIPAEAGGNLLSLLAKWEPGDAEALKSILRKAVAKKVTEQSVVAPQSSAEDKAGAKEEGGTDLKKKTRGKDQTVIAGGQEYAKALLPLLKNQPLDADLLASGIHHAPKPERFIIKLRLDLAKPAIIELANPKDPAVARWQLYQALTQDDKYVPTWSELEDAGLDMNKDSLPALRAHRNRGGLYIIPCQFILHLGESKLRVAVFSAPSPQNQTIYALMREVAARLPLPEGLRLSDIRSKTFQLDGTIADPGHLSIEELYAEIQRIWGNLLLFLGRLDKIITADIARALMKEHAGRPLLADDYVLITDEGAAALKRHDDELQLNGLTSLSERAARELSQNNETLHLDGLKDLSEEAAEAFEMHKGDLSLRGLAHLSDAAARALARHRGRLYLDGLATLPDYTALALSERAGDDLDFLSLNGLTSLSTAAARSLAHRRGGLSLQGLTSLSDAAAEALSGQASNKVDALRLDGLTSLSDAVARALADYAGEVQFGELPPEDQQRYETYRQQH
jgi:hypothetical protein